VLEIDPENPNAMKGLAGLQDEIDNAASGYQREGKLVEARMLLSAAMAHYEDDVRYGTRIAILDQKIAELETQQQLQVDLLALDGLMNQQPLTVDLIDRIAASLRDISGKFPDEVEVSERLSRFVTMISDEAGRISQGGDAPGALAMLDHALIMYPSNTRLSQALSMVQRHQVERQEEDQKRIVAMSGVLAIDATPWGRVLEVRNSVQELQQLPASTDTPLFLTLLEGEYSILVATADGESQTQLTVRVKRQGVVTSRPEMTLMNAQEYFEKSGW